MADFMNDRRIDPRVKAILSMLPNLSASDVSSRQEMLDEASQESAVAQVAAMKAVTDFIDNEELAPSKGLTITEKDIVSEPDGNTIKLRIIRPDTKEKLACIYYIHGGGMASLSAFDGNYRAWGKIIAAKNVAVVMVEFRNSIVPSEVKDIAPFPGGLNDCISGFKWTIANADSLNIDAKKITIAGESGGGNLTLATALALKKEGNLGLVKGLYALCPYIVGKYPDARFPSTVENNGIFIDIHNNRGIHGYGIEEFNSKNPIAWPAFATVEDVKGFPPTVISVNECDPLRDEGVEFYRLLLEAGVQARGRMILGTMHGTEILPIACPDISHDTARHMADFANS
jgi:acetyl esterase/lipase